MKRLLCRLVLLVTHPLSVVVMLALVSMKYFEQTPIELAKDEDLVVLGVTLFLIFIFTNRVYRKARNWSYRLRREREWANALALEEALLMPMPPLPDPAPAPQVIIQPEPVIPKGPEMPAPSRVKVLVRQAPAAASPDEATMQRQLLPALRELMRRSGKSAG